MTKKDRIIISYYEERLNIIDEKIIAISKKLKVTKQYVSKVIKKDERYNNEKNRRKQESAIRQRQRNINCINKTRYIKRANNEMLNGFLETQHRQASGELSGKRTISNRALKQWNSSIYEYHSRTREFRIKEEFKNKTSYAMPKKIKWD